jgi:tetratricopeptide (TPR) repeat protein
MELEREQEAIPHFERLCAFKEESTNPDKATLAMAYSDLAEAYRVTGKYPESEEKYLRALTITEDLRGKDHAAVGSLLQELSQLCDRQGKKEEAETHRERAAAIFQKVMEEQEAAGQESDDLKL